MTRTPTSVPSLPEVLARTGASYKQLDHWVRRGWITVGRVKPSPATSGNPRVWPDEEITVAHRMVAYISAGLIPEAAHHAARNDGWLPGHGFQLVEPDPMPLLPREETEVPA